MGKRSHGLRQVTLYADPALYERVRCAAYAIGEDIYQFVGEAMAEAITRRLTPAQRAAVDRMARQKVVPSNPRGARRGA